MKTQSALVGGDIVVRDEGLLTAEVDGELVAMSIDRGVCYGLNSVGSRIWALLAEPRSIDDLCRQLLSEFDVGADDCRDQVLALLEDLRAEAMVTVTPLAR